MNMLSPVCSKNTKPSAEYKIYPNDHIDMYPPKIMYKEKLHYDDIDTGDKSKHQTKKYAHEPNTSDMVHYVMNNVEPDAYLTNMCGITKQQKILPNNGMFKRRTYNDGNPNSCVNMVRESYYSDTKVDPEMTSEMILGMPSHTKKSYGFNDTFEHSFDYIDGDIQDSRHVVLPFPRGGISSRLENKKITKRDIY